MKRGLDEDVIKLRFKHYQHSLIDTLNRLLEERRRISKHNNLSHLYEHLYTLLMLTSNIEMEMAREEIRQANNNGLAKSSTVRGNAFTSKTPGLNQTMIAGGKLPKLNKDLSKSVIVSQLGPKGFTQAAAGLTQTTIAGSTSLGASQASGSLGFGGSGKLNIALASKRETANLTAIQFGASGPAASRMNHQTGYFS